MNITKYPNEQDFDNAVKADEPLLVLISFDGDTVIASQIDEAVEHNILLRKVKGSDADIDKYFRLVVEERTLSFTLTIWTMFRDIPSLPRASTTSLPSVTPPLP